MDCPCPETVRPTVPWAAVVEHQDFGNACASVTAACLDCGRLPGEPDWYLERSHLLMLRAGARIGRKGTWKKLGLPEFREVSTTVGPPGLIQRTIRRRRFHTMYENRNHQSLEGLVREALSLPRNNWSYGLTVRGWNCPLVIHHGLAWKFARKRDRPHLFLANYIGDALKYPTEVWLGAHRGKPRIRFFKKLSTASDIHVLLVCADPRDSIVVTAYIVAPHVCDASREGSLLYASWTTPSI